MSGMKERTTLGRQGVGVVEELGDDVRNFDLGDRVVVCAMTAAAAVPTPCRLLRQCEKANPSGPDA
jgi:threonine dehydrogenase-like Zn-dependent dehydrogenase